MSNLDPRCEGVHPDDDAATGVRGWHQKPLVAVDFETTGIDVETARVVTASIIAIGAEPGQVHERAWLVDPGVEIPAEASAIHGVTTEQARAGGTPAEQAVGEIVGEVLAAHSTGHPLVLYNAAYDLTLLDRESRRHYGVGLPDLCPVIDPFVIDRHVDRYRKGKRTLSAACEHYNVRLDAAHTSASDAVSAARVAWRIATVYPDLAAMDPAELHAAQIAWHAEWAEGFQSYLAKQGEAETVDGSWPLRPYVPAQAVAS